MQEAILKLGDNTPRTRYVINSIFALLLSKLEKRDWLVACMISREASAAA
jgi:hypothetical protein